MEIATVSRLLEQILDYDYTAVGGRFEDKQVARELLEEQFSKERQREQINDSDLLSLSNTLDARWDEISFTELDYTRCQKGQNASWISLAKALAEAGLIDENYYRFLMPTVGNDVDFASDTSFFDIPLNELIVSDDGKRLIRLQTALENSKHRGKLAYFENDKEFPLSENEKERFRQTNPTLWGEYAQEVLPKLKDNLRLSEETVLAVKTLAEDSVFDSGAAGNYSASEQAKAEKAYDVFREYLLRLTKEEHHALMSQRIQTISSSNTFKSVFMDAVQGKSCITYLAANYGQLVADYMPEVGFNNSRLTTWADSRSWREQSKRKKFSGNIPLTGYEQSNEFYQARCYQLFAYILSHRFELSYFGGHKISFGKQENRVTQTGSNIYRVLMKAMEEGDYRKAYFNVVEHHVKPACNSSSPSRSNDTWAWLRSIVDDSFFPQDYVNQPVECLGTKLLCFIENLDENSDSIDKESYYRSLFPLLLNVDRKPSALVELNIILKCLEDEVTQSENDSLQTLIEDKDNKFGNPKANSSYFSKCLVNRYVHYLAHKAQNKPVFLFFEKNNMSLDYQIYIQLKGELATRQAELSVEPQMALLQVHNFLSHLDFINEAGLSMANEFIGEMLNTAMQNIEKYRLVDGELSQGSQESLSKKILVR